MVHDVAHELDDAKVERVDPLLGKALFLCKRPRPRAAIVGGGGAGAEGEAVPLEGFRDHRQPILFEPAPISPPNVTARLRARRGEGILSRSEEETMSISYV